MSVEEPEVPVQRREHTMGRLRTRVRELGLDSALVAKLPTPMIDAFVDLECRLPRVPDRAGKVRASDRSSRPRRFDLR